MDKSAPPPDGHKLNDLQWFTLRAVADVIVPPSAEYNIPGAGDEAICKSVLRDVGERLPRLIDVLNSIQDLVEAGGGECFYELSAAERERMAQAFQEHHGRHADRLAHWVVQAYYRDDRVLESLNIEARPPFPQGYEVPDGDWSKLDAVRNRQPFYREPK